MKGYSTFPQSSRTRASPSNSLVSYLGCLFFLRGGYPFFKRAVNILQPQLTGLKIVYFIISFILNLRGAYDKFPDFFLDGHLKLL